MSKKSKVTSKGQITIPAEVRQALNIQEGDHLIFESIGEYEIKVRVANAKPLSSHAGALRSPKSASNFKALREEAYNHRAQEKFSLEDGHEKNLD